MGDLYITRQRERDSQYASEYAAWMASLPPEERRRLKELGGLDEPSLPSDSRTASDAADSYLARCEAVIQEDIDDSPPPVPYLDSAALLRRVVGELLAQDRIKLALECLALVTGIAYEGNSETDIAARHGVHRATVSNRCVSFAASFNLPYSRAMRGNDARKSYRKARTLHLRASA